MFRKVRDRIWSNQNSIGRALVLRQNSHSRQRGLSRETYDALETRCLLAFAGFFDGTTLTLTQTVDDGAAVIDNNGAGNAFRATDGSGLITYVAATNLIVNMLDNTGNLLDLQLDNAHLGNVTLNLGDGPRAVDFLGLSNSIGGDLNVNGGAGDQSIEVAVNAGLAVTGSATFDLGLGLDTIDEDNNNISIGVDFNLIGVNKFENGGVMTVGGNMSSDTSAETISADVDNDNSLTINGNFSFLGGSGEDFVQLNATTSVLGNVLVSLGDSSGGFGAGQTFRMNDAGNSVGGTLTVTAGNNLDGFSDDFLLNTTGTFGGDITVAYGAGTNDIQFLGVFGGSNVRYTGGGDTDNVTFGMTGNPANVNLLLGAGNDSFNLNAGASISPTTLRVDFGGGTDTFNNNFGAFTFNANFLNWDNFNRFYSVALDQWNIVQLANDGNVTLANSGPGGAIQFTNTYLTNMSPSANVRVNMLPNTGNVAVDFDSPLGGFLVITAKSGDRNIDFIGTSNNIGGSLFIDADAGAQKVELAVNAPLVVGGHAVINLRTGYDIVDIDANSISVGNNLIFRGVNEFKNAETVNVGNFTMNTTFEVERARLDNDGSFNVAGNFTYLGGQEKDDIILNDGVSIVGNTFISLGENISAFAAQNVNLTGGFQSGGFVSVLGGQSFVGNSVVTDASTTIGKSFIIDFSANSSGNFAVIDGTFGDSFGIFKGGSGNDVVSMDEVAGDMDFFLDLGDGADTFNLGDGTSLNYLYVNFGDGFDTFNDDFFGFYPFATAFWNLP